MPKLIPVNKPFQLWTEKSLKVQTLAEALGHALSPYYSKMPRHNT